MKDIFTRYILTFLHPFKANEKLRSNRLLSRYEKLANPLEVVSEELPPNELTFMEAMSVSWVFATIKGLYALIAMNLGIHAYQIYKDEHNLAEIFIPNLGSFTQKFALAQCLLQVVFFPLSAYIFVKFWQLIINFFGNFFNVEDKIEIISKEITHHALTANIFLIIPIFGELAKKISFMVHLFAGLRKNMGLNVTQSLFVLISPLVAFLLMLSLLGISILMLINIA